MHVLTASPDVERYTRPARPSELQLTVVRHDSLPLEAAQTLALNLAVAAALQGRTALVAAAALPAAMRADAGTVALPAGARSGAWTLPLVHAAPDGDVVLRPRSAPPNAPATVRISIEELVATESAPLSWTDRTGTADWSRVVLLPVSDELQLRAAAMLVADAACVRIVLPRILARRTDRWALVEYAAELAGAALCRTTVPFGRRDRATLYAPTTRAAHAYAMLLAELSAS